MLLFLGRSLSIDWYLPSCYFLLLFPATLPFFFCLHKGNTRLNSAHETHCIYVCSRCTYSYLTQIRQSTCTHLALITTHFISPPPPSFFGGAVSQHRFDLFALFARMFKLVFLLFLITSQTCSCHNNLLCTHNSFSIQPLLFNNNNNNNNPVVFVPCCFLAVVVCYLPSSVSPPNYFDC